MKIKILLIKKSEKIHLLIIIKANITHHGEGEHNHGHNHNNLINGLKDCEVVIFNAGGWRIIEDLKANNIIPFLTEERIADEAAQKYINGELIETENNACNHH